jgi:hypothetical protein
MGVQVPRRFFAGEQCDILFKYLKVISMAAISLKLPEDLLEASGRYADALRLTRAEYIRRALEQMNRGTRARLRARRLRDASHKVRGESMRVNAEFAAIERDVDA